MSRVEQIEAELKKLSPSELRQIRDRLDDLMKDVLEFTPDFEAAIRPEREAAASIQPRVRKP